MKIQEVIRAAIPDASEDMCEHILWGRTSYPFSKVTAKDIYKAAFRLQRSCNNENRMCTLCDRLATGDGWTCDRCKSLLDKCREAGSGRSIEIL